METADLNAAIENEFTCHYQIDTLPATWSEEALQTDLPRRARSSASRLRQAVGEKNVSSLIQLLTDMRQDPQHPMVQNIGSYTLLVWTDETEDWRVFQQLMDLLITHLSTNISSKSTS